jgi:ribonuclease HI
MFFEEPFMVCIFAAKIEFTTSSMFPNTHPRQMDIRNFFSTGKAKGTEVVPLETDGLYNPFLERKLITYTNQYKIIKGILAEQKNYAVLIQFDGAADPNPGLACGAAALFQTENGSTWKPICEGGVYNHHWTNNQAEYEGLLLGLRMAQQRGIKEILIEGDSALVISQTTKEWKVRDPKMQDKQNEVQDLLKHFTFVGARHVLRHFNQYADALSKEGIVKGENFMRLV